MENNQFRGFNILSELGSGAFSKTLLAELEGKRAVIKIIELPNEASAQEFSPEYTKSEKFAEDMRTTGTELNNLLKTLTNMPRINGILKYYDYTLSLDSDRGIYTLAILMQYDVPLQTIISAGEVPIGAILRMGSQLCDGLEIMLKKFVMHGNIKESNIFYNPTTGFSLGDYYINDILSATLIPDRHFKSYGYRFLAPEAYTGEEYSYKTDVFSLGMMMYKILNNNRLPFDDEPNTPLKKIKARWEEAKVLPPPAMNIPELTKVIAKATAYNKDERYSTFLQFKASLDRLLSTLPKEVLYTKTSVPTFDSHAISEKSTAESSIADDNTPALSAAEAAFHPSDAYTPPAHGAFPVSDTPPAEKQEELHKNKRYSKTVVSESGLAETYVSIEIPTSSLGELPEPTAYPHGDTSTLPRSRVTEYDDEDDIPSMPTERYTPDTDWQEPAAHERYQNPFADDAPIVPKHDFSPEKRPASNDNHVNPLMPPDDTEQEAPVQRVVRPLKHYEPPSGITPIDRINETPKIGEKSSRKKHRMKIPNDSFDYFDFNSEEYLDLSPKKKNRRIIMITAFVVGFCLLAVAAGFLVKFLTA